MARPFFDPPDYPIGPGLRFRLRDDASEYSSGPMPPLVIVRSLPTGKVLFYDAARPTDEYEMPRADFRDGFDPA